MTNDWWGPIALSTFFFRVKNITCGISLIPWNRIVLRTPNGISLSHPPNPNSNHIFPLLAKLVPSHFSWMSEIVGRMCFSVALWWLGVEGDGGNVERNLLKVLNCHLIVLDNCWLIRGSIPQGHCLPQYNISSKLSTCCWCFFFLFVNQCWWFMNPYSFTDHIQHWQSGK